MQICGTEYTLQRARLKTWLELDSISEKAKEADNSEDFAEAILSYVSVSLAVPKEDLETLSWIELAEIYIQCVSANFISERFPILRSTPTTTTTKAPWEYEGRTWYLWAHLLSKSYGWSLEYVENLDPATAIALIQEISVEEQLDKEWQWSLTEMAYPYNQTTKKSEFKELPRPDWMQKEFSPPKKTKIPMSMIPVGNVIRYVKDEEHEDTKVS